jgi:hypothetical protein
MNQIKIVSRVLSMALLLASLTSSIALASTSTATTPSSIESFSDKVQIWFGSTVTSGCTGSNIKMFVYYSAVPDIQAMAFAAFLSGAKLTCQYTCSGSPYTYATATSCSITN